MITKLHHHRIDLNRANLQGTLVKELSLLTSIAIIHLNKEQIQDEMVSTELNKAIMQARTELLVTFIFFQSLPNSLAMSFKKVID
ncbi:hypothetical protein Sjap_024911 [Stephania japonica]|uniref:Uncharacterized protein n=1 Tax=Stephania japonica TaxID=461633 RepID=A0AAP0EMX2_9MAGN